MLFGLSSIDVFACTTLLQPRGQSLRDWCPRGCLHCNSSPEQPPDSHARFPDTTRRRSTFSKYACWSPPPPGNPVATAGVSTVAAVRTSHPPRGRGLPLQQAMVAAVLTSESLAPIFSRAGRRPWAPGCKPEMPIPPQAVTMLPGPPVETAVVELQPQTSLPTLRTLTATTLSLGALRRVAAWVRARGWRVAKHNAMARGLGVSGRRSARPGGTGRQLNSRTPRVCRRAERDQPCPSGCGIAWVPGGETGQEGWRSGEN